MIAMTAHNAETPTNLTEPGSVRRSSSLSAATTAATTDAATKPPISAYLVGSMSGATGAVMPAQLFLVTKTKAERRMTAAPNPPP